MLTRIRQEGFRHSQVMATASELDDRIGPRLTASPNMKRANEWTRDQLAQWGLANAHLESWGAYDRGWQQETAYRMRQSEDEAGTPVTRMLPRSLLVPPGPATHLALFFLACVLVAGIYGGFTANKRIWLLQALPAAIALLAVIFT